MPTEHMILQLGTGGVLALLIVREVLAFANTKRNGGIDHPQDLVDKNFCDERHKNVQRSLDRLEKKVDDLPRLINGKT